MQTFFLFLFFFILSNLLHAQTIKLDDFSFNAHLLTQLDYAAYGKKDHAKNLGSGGMRARRIYTSLKGEFKNDWDYELKYDFAGEKASLKDAYLGYKINHHLKFIIGHHLQDAGMEWSESTGNLIFIERAVPYSAWPDERTYGLSLKYLTENLRISFGFGGNNEKEASSNNGTSNAGAFRFNYRFYFGDKIFHIGAATRLKMYEKKLGDKLNFKTRPAAVHFDDLTLVNTGTIIGTKSTLFNVLELLYVGPNFMLASEYHHQRVITRGNISHYNFKGYYAQTSYTFGGTQRVYDKQRGTPGKVLGNGYEVGIRFDHLDLNSKGIVAGRETDYTGIFSWYPNENIKILAQISLARINYPKSTTLLNENPWSYGVRTQFHF